MRGLHKALVLASLAGKAVNTVPSYVGDLRLSLGGR